jgi:succinoglycan biosynthesis protein ExoU
MQPSVSIIIAAYNAEATIVRAIRSALAQPEVANVFVVDDASSDRTVSIVQSLQGDDSRIQIIMLSANQGPSIARNRALDLCTDEWVGILDADDFFLTGRIARLLQMAGHADIIADDMLQQDENADAPRSRTLLDGQLTEPRSYALTEFVEANISKPGRKRAELGFIKPIIRRDFLASHKIRYQENMRLGEDYELYARCLGLGARLCIIPQAGYVSVVRPHSLSGRHSKHDLIQLRNADATLIGDLKLTGAAKKAVNHHALSIECRIQWLNLIDAIKEKRPFAALRAFINPPVVQRFLIARLAEQCDERILRRGARRSI